MKKMIIVIVLFLGVFVIAASFSELETILAALQKAHLGFFILAIFIQIIWFITTGKMYQSIYHLLGIHGKILTLSKIATAANFINVVAPTAGVGGVALFASEARRRGHPPGKVTVAAALFLALDQAAFLVILAFGLVILWRRNDLDAGEISASIFLFVIAVAYAFILYLGYRSETKLAEVLARLVHLVNRLGKLFRKDEYLSETRAREFAHEIADGFSGLTEKPSSLIRPVL